MGRSSSSPPPPQHKQHNHRRPFRGDHYHHHHHPGARDRSPSSIQFHGTTEIHGGSRDHMNHHHHKARKISNTSSIRGHGNGYGNHHHHHHHAASQRNYHGQYNTTSTGRGRTSQISLHHRETNPNPNPNFNPNPSSRSSNSNSSCNTAAPPFAASVAMAGMNDGRSNPPPPPPPPPLRDHRTITSVCYSANNNEPDPSSLPIQGEEAMKGKDLGGVPPRSGAGADGNPRQRRYQELFSLHQDLQQRNNNNESLEMSKRKQEAWELACALAHAYVFQGDYSSSSSSSRSPRPPPMLHNTTMNHLVDVENKKEEAPSQPRVSSREESGEQDLTAPSSSSIQSSCMYKKAAVVAEKEEGGEAETRQTTSREEEMEEPSSLVSEERKRGDDSSSPTDAPSMEGLEEERSHLPSSLHDLNTSSAEVQMKKPWPSMRPLHYPHPCGKLPEEEKPEASSSSPSLPDSSSKSSAPQKNIGSNSDIGSKKNIGPNLDIRSKKNFGSKPDEGTITSKPNPRPVFIDLNIDLNTIPLDEEEAEEDVKNCDVNNNSEPLNPLYTATMGPTSRRHHHHDQFASPSIIDLNATPPTEEDDWADGCETTNGSSANDRCETTTTDWPWDKCETADRCETMMTERLSGKECEMMDDPHGGLRPPHEESGGEEEEEDEDMGEEELVCIEEVVNPTQAAEWFGTHFPSPAALVS